MGNEDETQEQGGQPAAEPGTSPALSPEAVKMLNQMFSTYTKRLESRQEKSWSQIAAPLQQFQEFLARQQQPAQADEPEVKAQLSNLQKRLEAAERARDEEKRAREEEKAARKREEERNLLMNEARRIGVSDPILVEAFAERYAKRLGRDEHDRIVFNIQRGDYTDARPVAEAIDELVKTEAKSFIAPRGVGGSGASKANAANGAPNGVLKNGKMTQDAANQTLGAILGGFGTTE